MATEKGRLRRELAARRAALTPEERTESSAAIAARVLAQPEVRRARGVFACLSFGDEVDTWPLVEELLSEGRELYVPRTTRGDARLHVHRYPCALETLSFGLRQPSRTVPELTAAEIGEKIDVALVAGLAFDRHGFRLGYGAGYFDRFLAGAPFPALGLAFTAQIVDRLPVEPHDVAMRAVLSEDERIEGPPPAS